MKTTWNNVEFVVPHCSNAQRKNQIYKTRITGPMEKREISTYAPNIKREKSTRSRRICVKKFGDMHVGKMVN